MGGVFSKPSAPAPAPAPAPEPVAKAEPISDVMARRKKAEDRTLGTSTTGGDGQYATKVLLGQ